MLTAPVAQCWNTIGVRGDRSCPHLTTHRHCRNCPVYATAASAVFERDAPAEYLAESTAHFAAPRAAQERQTQAVLLFRVAAEWLGLRGAVVEEVTPLPVIHSMPHRRSGHLSGLANLRGELLPCISLADMLGLQAPPSTDAPDHRRAARRLLALRRGDIRVVCPVDEVHGIHRFDPRELTDVPTTVAKASASYSRALLAWNGQLAGILDDELLFYTLKRSLA